MHEPVACELESQEANKKRIAQENVEEIKLHSTNECSEHETEERIRRVEKEEAAEDAERIQSEEHQGINRAS